MPIRTTPDIRIDPVVEITRPITPPLTTEEYGDATITRDKLEYPTVDVSFAYLCAINKVMFVSHIAFGVMVITRDSFGNKALFGACQVNNVPVIGARITDRNNMYFNQYNPTFTASDHILAKVVAGTATTLATEAIDIDNSGRGLMISCSGTSIKSMRFEMTNPIDPLSLPTPNYTISTTDTSFSSGKWGFRTIRESHPHGAIDTSSAYLKAPASPSPKILGYYEVPIIGDGSYENPFRPNLPEVIEIIDKTELDNYDIELVKAIKNNNMKVNRIALSWSALIPTDLKTGKPINSTCIVLIRKQTERQKHLWKVNEALAKIEKNANARKLDVNQAKNKAIAMDKKLKESDLVDWE
jgi:hypothetical protein